MKKRPSAAQSDELRRLVQHLFRRFGALNADTTPCKKPLSMVHAHALMVLLARDELSQQELSAELCVDKSNVARLCAKMADDGHVQQRTSESDARSRRVQLTARGKRLALEVEASSRQRFATLLGAVPANSRAHVLDALQQLVVALDTFDAEQATP